MLRYYIVKDSGGKNVSTGELDKVAAVDFAKSIGGKAFRVKRYPKRRCDECQFGAPMDKMILCKHTLTRWSLDAYCSRWRKFVVEEKED